VTDDAQLVVLGEYSRLSAQVLRNRLETAGIPVMMRLDGNSPDSAASVLVPAEQAAFAWAVVNEIEVDDEVPDNSPYAYVARIEEHLSAAAELLDELRSRLDALDDDRS
jgi:hypothetical protein